METMISITGKNRNILQSIAVVLACLVCFSILFSVPTYAAKRRTIRMTESGKQYTLNAPKAAKKSKVRWSIASGKSYVRIKGSKKKKKVILLPKANGSGVIACRYGKKTEKIKFTVNIAKNTEDNIDNKPEPISADIVAAEASGNGCGLSIRINNDDGSICDSAYGSAHVIITNNAQEVVAEQDTSFIPADFAEDGICHINISSILESSSSDGTINLSITLNDGTLLTSSCSITGLPVKKVITGTSPFMINYDSSSLSHNIIFAIEVSGMYDVPTEPVSADIRIGSNGDRYQKTIYLDQTDFKYDISGSGTGVYSKISIPDSDIARGTSSHGTIYIDVKRADGSLIQSWNGTITNLPYQTSENTQPVSYGYIGNKRTHIFHKSSCSSVIRMSSSNKVSFGSRDEAISNGYTPCQICNP